MKWTKNDHKTWQILFSRQVPNIHRLASQEFLEGFALLKLSENHIPNLKFLNQRIHKASGWTVVRTPVRYLSDVQWAEHMRLKKFPITNFLRTQKELDFTPEPDIFHDIFGHLPMLMNPTLVRILNIFSEFYTSAAKDDLPLLAQLWWNTIEFSLIHEKGKLKVFGAGLMSSFSEIEHSLSEETQKIPFSIQDGVKKPRQSDSFHQGFLTINSMEELQSEILKFSSLRQKGAL